MKTKRETKAGYTLVELLVVLAIMGLLLTTGLSVGTLNTRTMTGSAGIISRVFDEARTYAMSNHTYVTVGITETAANSYLPNHALTAGTGCVIVEIVATKDGTNNSSSTLSGTPAPNLIPLNRPYLLNNLHLVDLSGNLSGNMARPSVTGPANLTASTSSGVSLLTPSSWPQSSFNGVFVNFDPQGSAHIVASFTSNPITISASLPLLELGIQESHGSSASAATQNYAALQIEGISGVSHLYQP